MRKPPFRGFLLLAGLAAAGWLSAEDLSRAEAEARLHELKSEIQALQASLTQARKSFSSETESLRSLDLDIQSTVLDVRSVQQRINEQRVELEQSRQDKETYLTQLEQRKDALSQQIVAAYQLGRESRLKLLLNQDKPQRVGRMMAYYDYYNAAQVEHISELRAALATLDRLQAAIDLALERLNAERADHERALTELQERRAQRQTLLAELERQIMSSQQRLEELASNQADLEALIERLADALADIPSDLGQYHHPREQRGALPMPLDGRVRHAFGQSRASGMAWQGWLIGAGSGAEVRAVAYGRVAYADWLRGYGLLIILDHGDGFMSLYGNNESLLFEPGDWVQPGEIIATVGENPGNEQGLYFELRNNGHAVDPAQWVKRR